MMRTVADAKALMSAGETHQALGVLNEILAERPNLLAAHMLSAAALIRLERGYDALPHLETCAKDVDKAPNPVRARTSLAAQFANAGAYERAAEMLKQARDLDPDSLEVAVRHADLMAKQGKWYDALDIYRGILRELPGHSAVEASAGIAAQHTGELEEAVRHYEAAIKGNDQHLFVYNNLLAVLMELGRTDDAYRHAADWLRREPSDIEAMAFHALLAVEAGDAQAAATWFDFDTLLHVSDVAVPSSYADLAAFNRALEDHILNYPELKTPPENHPTWHHPALKIGANINGHETTGPMADLEILLHTAVETYLEGIGTATHPYLAHRPARYTIEAWAAVLDRQGNQLPHIHKSGYLSGCYYVTIPDEIAAAEPDEQGLVAGGLEVGRPPVELLSKATFPSRVLKPHEGMMVLFPAYLYHGTVPFKSSQRRISVAFDVIPAR